MRIWKTKENARKSATKETYMSYSSGKWTQTHTDTWNFYTLLLCHRSRGREPNRQKGSGCYMSTRAAFYMRLKALRNIPLAVSDLSISLLFMPAVKVWVPCHNFASVIFLSQNLWGKKADKRWKKHVGFYNFSLITKEEYTAYTADRET